MPDTTISTYPVVKGHYGPILQEPRWEYDAQSGWSLVQPYRCANQAQVQLLVNQYQFWRVPMSITGIAPNIILETRYRIGTQTAGGQEVPQDSWEIQANEVHEDIYKSPNALLIEASKTGSLGAIRKDYDYYCGRRTTDSGFSFAGAGVTLAPQMMTMLIRGVESYAVTQYVLRHRMRVSGSYATPTLDANVGKIYTTAQLLAECAGFFYPLPARMKNKLAAIPSGLAAGDSALLWGWRKMPSIESAVAGGAVEIATEWWLAGWSLFLYSAVT